MRDFVQHTFTESSSNQNDQRMIEGILLCGTTAESSALTTHRAPLQRYRGAGTIV
jgi:hypothetical protein